MEMRFVLKNVCMLAVVVCVLPKCMLSLSSRVRFNKEVRVIIINYYLYGINNFYYRLFFLDLTVWKLRNIIEIFKQILQRQDNVGRKEGEGYYPTNINDIAKLNQMYTVKGFRGCEEGILVNGWNWLVF